MLLLWTLAALAQDAVPAPPAEAPAPAVDEAEAEDVGGELDIVESSEVIRKRAEVYAALKQEGYRQGRDLGDRTVFLARSPWKPRVIVHDDGWVYLKRQPPRIHAPGRSFADQGHPAEYLLCIIAAPTCVSIGGWVVSDRKLGHVKAEVYDATREEVRAFNDAVARRELGHRLNEDIPKDLERIWGSAELSPADRRLLLFTYWDTRTETPEGMAARGAVRAFLLGVVQQSDTPFSAEELAALNARRESADPLTLSGAP